jgi:hypothetical protein
VLQLKLQLTGIPAGAVLNIVFMGRLPAPADGGQASRRPDQVFLPDGHSDSQAAFGRIHPRTSPWYSLSAAALKEKECAKSPCEAESA